MTYTDVPKNMLLDGEDLKLLRDSIQEKTPDERIEFLKTCSSAELSLLFFNPQVFLFDKQIPPSTEWRYHWYRGGRGIGKTYASTSWLYEKIIRGAQEVAIVGATYGDLVKDVLPVFESHFHPDLRPKFNEKKNIYECFNGCIVKVYSSDTEIRGLNAEYAIAEEMCKWCDSIPAKILECWKVFNLGVRKGKNPQIFISSTPKAFPFFIRFDKMFNEKNQDYSMVVAHTTENPHLSDRVKQSFVDEYGGTRLGRQELAGDLLVDNPDALWTTDLIEKQQITQQAFDKLLKDKVIQKVRSITTVDVAVSTNPDSDETGIMAGCLCNDGKVYILQDASGVLSPKEWADAAVKLYKKYGCSHIVMEKNQGGNLLEDAIKNVDPYVRVKLIHAKESKLSRFTPVIGAYERGDVWHVGNLNGLENQMVSFDPLNFVSSPDRIDAMAYIVIELLTSKRPISTRKPKNLGSW